MKKSETLKYISGFNQETLDKMTAYRAKFVELAKAVEELGESRELSLAFSNIEHAQMLVIKHICLAASEGKVQG